MTIVNLLARFTMVSGRWLLFRRAGTAKSTGYSYGPVRITLRLFVRHFSWYVEASCRPLSLGSVGWVSASFVSVVL